MRLLLPLLVLPCLAWSAEAGADDAPVADQTDLPALTVPALAAAPVIDGRIDESDWAGAALIDGLRPALGQRDASAGPALATRARLAWRPEALYIAVECRDAAVLATPGRAHDENLYDEDVVEFFVDAVGDGRAYWELQCSPLGQTMDLLHLLTAPPEYLPTGRFSSGFNTREHFGLREVDLKGAVVAATQDAAGWTVEAALPAEPLLKRLALKSFAPGVVLHLQLMRYDWTAPRETAGRKLLQANWVPVLSGCPHLSPKRMGTLTLAAAASVPTVPALSAPVPPVPPATTATSP